MVMKHPENISEHNEEKIYTLYLKIFRRIDFFRYSIRFKIL